MSLRKMRIFKIKSKDTVPPDAEPESKGHIVARPSTSSVNNAAPPDAADKNALKGVGYALKPLFSRQHRVAITQRCIASALSQMIEDAGQEEGTEDKQVNMEGEVPTRKSKYDWSGPLRMQWNWNRVFLIFTVHLQRAAPSAFSRLRTRDFSISPETYHDLFTQPLEPLSNLGLSGSAFFHTASKSPNNTAGLMIKSINRPFEYEFLHLTLLPEYISYFNQMEEGSKGDSILTRITDVIYCSDATLGGMLRLSPRHYMVMVDILGDIKSVEGARKWDLKPMFFEPTRDLVPDTLKSEATKAGLADTLDDDVRIKLARHQFNSLMRVMQNDTKFLQNLGIVDYSLLFGRWPSSSKNQIPVPLGLRNQSSFSPEKVGGKLKSVLGSITDRHKEGNAEDDRDLQNGSDFVRGVESADGEWIYRMTVVDFLWNVTKLVPVVMRTAGKAALLPDQTITTDPETYRTAFLQMIEEYVEVFGE